MWITIIYQAILETNNNYEYYIQTSHAQPLFYDKNLTMKWIKKSIEAFSNRPKFALKKRGNCSSSLKEQHLSRGLQSHNA